MDLPFNSSTSKPYNFLLSGGEMGVAIQSYDWDPTIIGPIDNWPQSLRSPLSFIVHSKIPMVLFWGESLICFYNDSAKHLIPVKKFDTPLGQPAKDIFTQNWSDFSLMISDIAESKHSNQQAWSLGPIFGESNKFTVSPVFNEQEIVAGSLFTFSEIDLANSKVKPLIDRRFSDFVHQANVGIIVLLGSELLVDVVNESYCKIVNCNIEDLMGKPLFDVLPDAASTFRPLLNNVMTTGMPLYMDETPFLVTINGHDVNGYVDLVYQPATDDDGTIIGVTAFIVDVTDKVVARKKNEESSTLLQFAIESADLATWDYNPKTLKFSGNDRLRAWFGFDNESEIFLADAIAAIDVKDQNRVKLAIARVLEFDSGGAYDIDYTLKNRITNKTRIVRAIGKCWFDDNQIAYRFNGTLQDVTQQVTSAQKLMDSEKQLRSIVECATLPIGVFIGRELRIFLANQSLMNIWGKGNDIVGKLCVDVVPELSDTVILSQIISVYDTGIPFNANNSRVDLSVDGKIRTGYFNYNFTPLFDGSGEIYGIIASAAEVTDIIFAKQKIEQSEMQLRNLIEQLPIATTLLIGSDFKVGIANDTMIGYWGKGPDVIGRPIIEIITELENQAFIKILDKVYRTGESEIDTNQEAYLTVDGKRELFYFDVSYKVMRDVNNDIYAVLYTAIDVTEQVLNRKKLEVSEQFARSIIHNSVVAQMVTTGKDMIVKTINQQMCEILGRDNAIIGQQFLDVIPELRDTSLLEKMRNVLHTGESYIDSEAKFEIIRNGKNHEGYYNYTYQAIRNAEGEIYGVLTSATEVTTQVFARKKIEESEQRVRNLIKAAPIAIGVFVGRDLIIETHNQTFLDVVGKGDGIMGLPLREAMPELLSEGQPFLKILDDVFTTGVKYQTFGTLVKIVQNGVLNHNYYDITYTPIYDNDGEIYAILDIAIDVTENVKAQSQIAESEKNLRNTILQSPVAMCILKGENQVVDIANDLMLALWGIDDSIIGKPLFDGLPEAKEQGFDALLAHVYTTGETYRAYDVPVALPRKDGPETVYVNFVYEAFRAQKDTITGVVAIAIDVTRQVLARKEIEEAEEKARLAIESADLGTYELNLQTDQLKTSDRFDAIWGPSLHSSRSSRANNIHPDDRELRSRAHAESLITGNLDYEARLLREDNSENHVRVKGKVIFDDQQRAISLLGIIQDITEQKRFAQQLSKLVDERTVELNRSNEDLLQFAHVASHDLKEPVRKIKVFSTMLEEQFGMLLPEKGHLYMQKVQNATERMFAMIEGILTYSDANASDQPIEKIDLNDIIRSIEVDLEVAIQAKGAKIISSNLPTIEGATVLIYQLFYNLINNALKFTKANVLPEIHIDASKMVKDGIQYAEIKVSDNGIGINPEYAEKIFTAFIRLHSKDKFEGTGLGLALCKKIVARHKGSISASGIINKGTVFTVTLPIN